MSKFLIGHQKVGGRTLGTPNKRFATADIVLEEIGLNPLDELAKISMDLTCDVNTRLSALKELAQYCYPKRKAIDHTHNISNAQVSEMSDEELENELMCGALTMLEKKLSLNGSLTEDQKENFKLTLSKLNLK